MSLIRGDLHIYARATDEYRVNPAVSNRNTGGAYPLPGTDVYVYREMTRPVDTRHYAIGIRTAPEVLQVRYSPLMPRAEGRIVRFRGDSVTSPDPNARFDDSARIGDVYGNNG